MDDTFLITLEDNSSNCIDFCETRNSGGIIIGQAKGDQYLKLYRKQNPKRNQYKVPSKIVSMDTSWICYYRQKGKLLKKQSSVINDTNVSEQQSV